MSDSYDPEKEINLHKDINLHVAMVDLTHCLCPYGHDMWDSSFFINMDKKFFRIHYHEIKHDENGKIFKSNETLIGVSFNRAIYILEQDGSTCFKSSKAAVGEEDEE